VNQALAGRAMIVRKPLLCWGTSPAFGAIATRPPALAMLLTQ